MASEYGEIHDAYYDRLVGQLRRAIPRIEGLPNPERRIAQLALEGRDVHEVAQQVGMSEDAVWRILATVAGETPEAVLDEPTRPFESAGLGADTDPGVTGGYGDTGFGSIGNEPDVPVTEEPTEVRRRRRHQPEQPSPERSEKGGRDEGERRG